MTDYNNIDEQFRDHQGDWEDRPSADAWDKLSARLDNHKHTGLGRRRTIYRWSAAASVALLLTLSIYMFNNSFQAGGFHAESIEMDVPEHASVNTDREIATTTTEEATSLPTTPSLSAKQAEDQSSSGFANGYRSKSASVDAAAPESDLSISEDLSTREITVTLHDDMSAAESVEEGYFSDDVDADFNAAEFTVAAESLDASGAIADEVIEAEEPEQLTQAVVANRIGIESAKSEHKQRDDKRGRKSGEAFPAASYNMETSDLEAETEQYQAAGDRLADFVTNTMIVLIPTEKGGTCRFTAFQIQDNVVYIDRCQEDKFDLLRSEAIPVDQASALSHLQSYDREYLQGLANKARNGPCLPSAKSIRIIYRTGTTLSYNEETVRLPLQEFCLPEEAKPIVSELKALRDLYVE